MKRGLLAVLFLLLLAGCQTVPAPRDPVSAADASRLRSLVLGWQEKAFSERRLKALYAVEMHPKVGPVVRGYVSFFWDGHGLDWRASAPMAGNVRGGRIERDGFESTGLLPVDIPAADVVGLFLGIPDWDFVSGPIYPHRGGYRIVSGAREMTFDVNRGVLSQALPGRFSAVFEPGDGLPRKITIGGPNGEAVFQLQSLLPWKVEEPVPPL